MHRHSLMQECGDEDNSNTPPTCIEIKQQNVTVPELKLKIEDVNTKTNQVCITQSITPNPDASFALHEGVKYVDSCRMFQDYSSQLSRDNNALTAKASTEENPY